MQAVAICRPGNLNEVRQLEQMYRLRADVFGKRLGWVECQEGYERDEFDALDPTYILAVDTEEQVVGCARLLPASGPTMLQAIFSNLLHGKPLLSHPGMVESSRFCVNTTYKGGTYGRPHLVTQTMLAAIAEWCCCNGYSEIVTVTDLRLERLLNRSGWPLSRLGQPLLINETWSVAGTLSADDATFERLRPTDYRSGFGRSVGRAA